MPKTLVDPFLDEAGAKLSAVHRHITKGMENLAKLLDQSRAEQERLQKENDDLVNGLQSTMFALEEHPAADPRTVIIAVMGRAGYEYETAHEGQKHGSWRRKDALHIVEGVERA